MSLAAVLCLLFPALLTTPSLREVYPMEWVRRLIHFSIILSFLLGCVGAWRAKNHFPGLLGVAFALVATWLGGADVPVATPVAKSNYVGLDWFLLDLFFTALVFVPLERLFALHPEQPVFRKGFRTDLAHFFVSHVLVQILTFLAVLPAALVFQAVGNPALQAAVAGQPMPLQFLEILLLSDMSEYWVHRALHKFPLLWRFHAIHHSSTGMDWIAASRLHLAEVLAMRGITYIPVYFLGFAPPAVYAYVVFVAFHAIFIHANVRWNFGRLESMFVTPRFHHWHHGAEAKAIDTNFALHFPLLDRLFGTLHMPAGRWPAKYGIEGFPYLGHYFAHLTYPFRREKKEGAAEAAP